MDEHDLGYMKATVEQNTVHIGEIKALLQKQHEENKNFRLEMRAELQAIRDEVNVYKTVIKLAKLLGYTAAFVLTLKFGDVIDLWRNH